jgi:hypothetical protein
MTDFVLANKMLGNDILVVDFKAFRFAYFSS